MVFILTILHNSECLNTYSYSPYNQLSDYWMKYPIEDVSVGDVFAIEVVFPDGSSSGTQPDTFTPKVYDPVTKTVVFNGYGSIPIPTVANSTITFKWVVGTG